MIRNYRVYVRATPGSAWRDTGIIESKAKRAAAEQFWTDLCDKHGLAGFKFEPITYGVAIER